MIKNFKEIGVDDFLDRNNFSKADFDSAGLVWDDLVAIAVDHRGQYENLRDAAEILARAILRFSDVHSVRWRIKDPEHLVAKIVRKNIEGVDKYKGLSVKDYSEVVTDLVGLRVLHLFKNDCLVIDRQIRDIWQPEEIPVVYIRKGDAESMLDSFKSDKFELKEHKAGYRSIHYIIPTQPIQRKVLSEVQVRTIFEEGWSEIDHRIRYPNFSNKNIIKYFLEIFNRMAGSADEMGSFVQGLSQSLKDYDAALLAAKESDDAKAKAMEDMEEMISAMRKEGAEDKGKLHSLETAMKELRKISESDSASRRSTLGLLPRGVMQIGSIGGSLGKGVGFEWMNYPGIDRIGNALDISEVSQTGEGLGRVDEIVQSLTDLKKN